MVVCGSQDEIEGELEEVGRLEGERGFVVAAGELAVAEAGMVVQEADELSGEGDGHDGVVRAVGEEEREGTEGIGVEVGERGAVGAVQAVGDGLKEGMPVSVSAAEVAVGSEVVDGGAGDDSLDAVGTGGGAEQGARRTHGA